MRPRQNGAFQDRGLQRIVSTQRHQGATQTAEGGEAREERPSRPSYRRYCGMMVEVSAGDAASGRAAPAGAIAAQHLQIGAARGVARDQDGEQIGKLRPQLVVRAGWSRPRRDGSGPPAAANGRRPPGAWRPGRLRPPSAAGASASGLDHFDIARAQPTETQSDLFILGQHHIEGRQQDAHRGRRAHIQRLRMLRRMRALTSAAFDRAPAPPGSGWGQRSIWMRKGRASGSQ